MNFCKKKMISVAVGSSELGESFDEDEEEEDEEDDDDDEVEEGLGG